MSSGRQKKDFAVRDLIFTRTFSESIETTEVDSCSFLKIRV